MEEKLIRVIGIHFQGKSGHNAIVAAKGPRQALEMVKTLADKMGQDYKLEGRADDLPFKSTKDRVLYFSADGFKPFLSLEFEGVQAYLIGPYRHHDREDCMAVVAASEAKKAEIMLVSFMDRLQEEHPYNNNYERRGPIEALAAKVDKEGIIFMNLPGNLESRSRNVSASPHSLYIPTDISLWFR